MEITKGKAAMVSVDTSEGKNEISTATSSLPPAVTLQTRNTSSKYDFVKVTHTHYLKKFPFPSFLSKSNVLVKSICIFIIKIQFAVWMMSRSKFGWEKMPIIITSYLGFFSAERLLSQRSNEIYSSFSIILVYYIILWCWLFDTLASG